MMTRDHYRIVYWIGSKPDLSTKMLPGQAHINDAVLEIRGATSLQIPLSEISDAQLNRHQGSMRMISFRWRQQAIYLTVVRINIAGYFVIVNFFGAGRLFKRLQDASVAST
jgi:hypothetical protein